MPIIHPAASSAVWHCLSSAICWLCSPMQSLLHRGYGLPFLRLFVFSSFPLSSSCPGLHVPMRSGSYTIECQIYSSSSSVYCTNKRAVSFSRPTGFKSIHQSLPPGSRKFKTSRSEAYLAEERVCCSCFDTTPVVFGDDGIASRREDEELGQRSDRHRAGFSRFQMLSTRTVFYHVNGSSAERLSGHQTIQGESEAPGSRMCSAALS